MATNNSINSTGPYSSSVLVAGVNSASTVILSTSSITYSSLNGIVTGQATIGSTQLPWPVNGTFSRLYVDVGNNGNTASGTWALNIAGSATALSATITASTTGVFSDTTHSVAVTAGQLVCMQGSQSTSGTTKGSWSLVFTPS